MPEYSIADIATWPWIRTASSIFPWLTQAAEKGDALASWPALAAWFGTLGARAAVGRGVAQGERFLDRDRAAFVRRRCGRLRSLLQPRQVRALKSAKDASP